MAKDSPVERITWLIISGVNVFPSQIEGGCWFEAQGLAPHYLLGRSTREAHLTRSVCRLSAPSNSGATSALR